MTALRQRLIDDLHLRGYAERTVESYVAVVARLARHFRAAPDQLSETQLRAYLLHLTRERKLARPPTNVQAVSAVRGRGACGSLPDLRRSAVPPAR